MNLNANYTSETVTQAPVGKLFVRPDGSSARYDMTDNWFCVNDRPRCGKEVALLENDPAWLPDAVGRVSGLTLWPV